MIKQVTSNLMSRNKLNFGIRIHDVNEENDSENYGKYGYKRIFVGIHSEVIERNERKNIHELNTRIWSNSF